MEIVSDEEKGRNLKVYWLCRAVYNRVFSQPTSLCTALCEVRKSDLREGYCSRPVCLSVYPSVPALAA